MILMGNVRHLPLQSSSSKSSKVSRLPVDVQFMDIANQGQFGWSSANWSGYAISSTKQGTYQSVSGTWRVPQVTPPAQPAPTSWWQMLVQWLQSLFGIGSGGSAANEYSATWIGIDGFNNTSLIQAGTAQNISNGLPQYYAWWEILPNPETMIDPNHYPVQANDEIISSIAQQPSDLWTITLQNVTQGWTFVQEAISYSGPQTSVEWIEEAPEVNGAIATLANYGEVSVGNCLVNGANPLLQASQGGVMVTQIGEQISTPSVPGPSGNDFNIQYGPEQPSPPSS